MHESIGKRNIGQAPSLHLFHTTLRQCMRSTTSLQPLLAAHVCSLVLRSLPPPTWPGNEASMTQHLCYSDIEIHGMVLASSPGHFPFSTQWLRNEANMI